MMFTLKVSQRHKLSRGLDKYGLTLLELIVVVIIIALLTGMLTPLVGTAIRRAKIQATEDKLDGLNEALLLYYEDYFDLPNDTGSDPADLAVLEPNYIRSSEYQYDYGYDAWRTAIRYTKVNNRTATLLSFGPDRQSGTSDDITYNVTSMSVWREYVRETQEELEEVNKSAEEYVRDGYSLSSSVTSVTMAAWLSDSKYQNDAWGNPYYYDSAKNTFYSRGPNGSLGGGDDIYPSGVP